MTKLKKSKGVLVEICGPDAFIKDFMPCQFHALPVNHFQTALSMLTLCKHNCLPGYNCYFWFVLPSCLCNRSFQTSVKVSLQVLLSSHIHKVKICVNSVRLSSLFIVLSFASTVPIHLSITTWSSMTLTASTPTLLKQNERFVPEFRLLLLASYSDKVAFL